MAFALAVNGRRVESEAPPLVPLVDVLRDELGLTGTKLACGEGRCGACSVLIDGELALSCLLPVVHADGRDVTTIEGLAGPEQELTPLQDALLEAGGVQCGACTPGMVAALARAAR